MIKNMDMLYNDYVSGFVMEVLEQEDIDIWQDNFQELDLMKLFYNHPCYVRAEEIAKARGVEINLDLFFDDMFAVLETNDSKIEDAINGLISIAWQEVNSEEFFVNKIFPNLDTEVLQVLGTIY